MNIKTIKSLLREQNLELFYFEKVISTNPIAKEKAAELTCGGVVFAEEQAGGRGRFDRRFHSPPGTGIYMSIVLKDVLRDSENPCHRAVATLITPGAAVAVARAVIKLAGKEPKIKWVNDLLIDNKKICGILTESSGNDAIVGIGINYTTDFTDLPELGAISIFSPSEARPSREEFAACVINELFTLIEKPVFMDEYRELSCLTGEKISYMQNNAKYFGTVTGIDDSGQLLVKNDKGEITALCSGEVMMIRKSEIAPEE
ncbi:MAG: biotin--[acetyl-CoA-carboxylase] ligase [Oscillospiraceae bacterium]|nr:biotin--[acetyl-CoA-carboxylase] ligase [Oscillospiraceae bacterium]